jgi:hypothetical protein
MPIGPVFRFAIRFGPLHFHTAPIRRLAAHSFG